jgi:hypothetical protein
LYHDVPDTQQTPCSISRHMLDPALFRQMYRDEPIPLASFDHPFCLSAEIGKINGFPIGDRSLEDGPIDGGRSLCRQHVEEQVLTTCRGTDEDDLGLVYSIGKAKACSDELTSDWDWS